MHIQWSLWRCSLFSKTVLLEHSQLRWQAIVDVELFYVEELPVWTYFSCIYECIFKMLEKIKKVIGFLSKTSPYVTISYLKLTKTLRSYYYKWKKWIKRIHRTNLLWCGGLILIAGLSSSWINTPSVRRWTYCSFIQGCWRKY